MVLRCWARSRVTSSETGSVESPPGTQVAPAWDMWVSADPSFFLTNYGQLTATRLCAYILVREYAV